jgi:membrane-associated phospholipid phosphatase
MTMTSQKPGRPAGRRHQRAAPHAVLFVLGAIVCSVALGWTYWAFVRTTTGQFADESALREAEAVSPATRGPLLDFLDLLPMLSVVIAAVVVAFVTLWRRRWAAAGIALGTVLAANLTTQVLKHLALERPDVGVPTLAFNSLPSGHTTLAASAAAAVFLVVSPRWRPLAATAGGTYAVLAGSSTLINLWHRPADVIAAFLVVALWTLVGGLLVMRTGSHWNVWSGYNEHWAASRRWVVLCWLVGLGAGACAAGLYLLAQWIGPAPVPGTGRVPLYYWAGLALIAGSGYLLSAMAASLFGFQSRRRRT